MQYDPYLEHLLGASVHNAFASLFDFIHETHDVDDT
jgi:hypothetical protein